jgi:hypothetical protein
VLEVPVLLDLQSGVFVLKCETRSVLFADLTQRDYTILITTFYAIYLLPNISYLILRHPVQPIT